MIYTEMVTVPGNIVVNINVAHYDLYTRFPGPWEYQNRIQRVGKWSCQRIPDSPGVDEIVTKIKYHPPSPWRNEKTNKMG